MRRLLACLLTVSWGLGTVLATSGCTFRTEHVKLDSEGNSYVSCSHQGARFSTQLTGDREDK